MHNYKYVTPDTDRHGNTRFYFRRKGQKKIRIQGTPGSDPFNTAYAEALAGSVIAKTPAKRTAIDSFGYVCLSYYASFDFKASIPQPKNNEELSLMQFVELIATNQ